MCSFCKVCQNQYLKKWKIKNSERIKKYKERWVKKNPDKWKLLMKKERKSHKESVKSKFWSVLSKGRMECICCKEKERLFLTLDHKKNNGGEERKKYKYNQTDMFRNILRDKNFEDYQILCFNCNLGRNRAKDKTCPHKIKNGKE